jgi:hypothetical protein
MIDDDSTEEGGKFVVHELNWGNDDDDWGSSKPKQQPYAGNFQKPSSSRGGRSKNDRQDTKLNYGPREGREEGYNNYDRGYGYKDSQVYRKDDYRRGQPQSSYQKDQYSNSQRQQRSNHGAILDSSQRKGDFTSIANFFNHKMQGNDVSGSHASYPDPGPTYLKKDSRRL